MNINYIVEEILKDFSLENYDNLEKIQRGNSDEEWQVYYKLKIFGFKLFLKYNVLLERITTKSYRIWVGGFNNVFSNLEHQNKLITLIGQLNLKKNKDLEKQQEIKRDKYFSKVFGEKAILD